MQQELIRMVDMLSVLSGNGQPIRRFKTECDLFPSGFDDADPILAPHWYRKELATMIIQKHVTGTTQVYRNNAG